MNDSVRAHRQLSEADWAFRQLARRVPERLRRGAFARLDRPLPLVHHRLQPWPTFVGRRAMEELAIASIGVHRLVGCIPRRLFDNDAERVAAYYDWDDPARVARWLAPPDGLSGALSRGDFVWSREGPICLECNHGGNLGGWETAVLARLLLSAPVVREFIAEKRLRVGFTDTLDVLFRHILRRARADGLAAGDRLRVVLATHRDGPPTEDGEAISYLRRGFAAVLAAEAPEVEGEVLASNYADITARGDILHAGEHPVQVLLEAHTHPTEEVCVGPFKAGRLHLYNGPLNEILSDKRNLALLSENADSERFDAAERRLIRRHIPWTRRVADAATTYRGATRNIPRLLLDERRDLVLKKGRSLGGMAVVMGRHSEPGEWARAVERALDEGGWVAQEHVESLPFLYLDEELGCVPHDAVWGPLVFGETFAGTTVRVQPQARGGVINAARGARQGLVLEVHEGSQTAPGGPGPIAGGLPGRSRGG